tara:strand:- start:520 stop:696 length:177 start_codon:yes stop_codon:yes gene_type:complete
MLAVVLEEITLVPLLAAPVVGQVLEQTTAVQIQAAEAVGHQILAQTQELPAVLAALAL